MEESSRDSLASTQAAAEQVVVEQQCTPPYAHPSPHSSHPPLSLIHPPSIIQQQRTSIWRLTPLVTTHVSAIFFSLFLADGSFPSSECGIAKIRNDRIPALFVVPYTLVDTSTADSVWFCIHTRIPRAMMLPHTKQRPHSGLP